MIRTGKIHWRRNILSNGKYILSIRLFKKYSHNMVNIIKGSKNNKATIEVKK